MNSEKKEEENTSILQVKNKEEEGKPIDSTERWGSPERCL
jgi:hypothetical protein